MHLALLVKGRQLQTSCSDDLCLMAADLKAAASCAIDSSSKELLGLGDKIWKTPELGFEEHCAHRFLTNFLEGKGFEVHRSFAGLETAFRATFGSGRPNVCVICEYDALPEIGHACGHNLIAEAGVAAGLGLKAALECEGAPKGRVTVMGTPAEETAGGKLNLIKSKAFSDVDVAMMVHPSPNDIISPITLGVSAWVVEFTGKAAHAAAYPWEGVNALDAAVMAYNSISLLRQQMKPTWRVHGVALNGGGTDPAIIPASTKLLYYIRAPESEELAVLERKVMACFEAAAEATGCAVTVSPSQPTFKNILSNRHLAKCYADNLQHLGKPFEMVNDFTISTDFGDVSHIVPAIHPTFSISSGGEVNHTLEFAAATNTPRAHADTLVAGKALAHTGIDVLAMEGLLEELRPTKPNT